MHEWPEPRHGPVSNGSVELSPALATRGIALRRCGARALFLVEPCGDLDATSNVCGTFGFAAGAAPL